MAFDVKVYNRQYYLDNRDFALEYRRTHQPTPEKQLEYKRRWQAKNKDHLNAKARERYRQDPEKHKAAQRRSLLKNKYGITLEEEAEMRERQKGLCAICSGPPNGRWPKLHIDHCHETGKVRGLLCHSCNVGLGNLGDTAKRVREALAYLERAEAA